MAASASDVAALAGVSQRTVSNVVRGYVHVRPETRARVQRAIDELKYRPNPSARSLRDSRTGIIGLAVPEIASPYFAELADHIQRVAATHHLTLLMEQTGADRERELSVLAGHRAHVIDGLIFSPMEITLEDLQQQEFALPTVLLGERIPHGGCPTVAIDNRAAAREATRHLLDGGRRRIAAVGANVKTNNVGAALGRLEGYRRAHQDVGRKAMPKLLVRTEGWGRSAGYAAVDALILSRTRFDALFCLNDVLAVGALRALLHHGVRVPDDVSVVGWDDVDEAAFVTPPLTSVSPDKAAIAEAAVSQLIAQIGGAPRTDEQVVCSYELVVRASSTGGRR
jgi:DNA-binding LacI/PurR family transcriptional regulator